MNLKNLQHYILDMQRQTSLLSFFSTTGQSNRTMAMSKYALPERGYYSA